MYTNKHYLHLNFLYSEQHCLVHEALFKFLNFTSYTVGDHVYLARGQKCKQTQSSYYGSRKHARCNIATMVATKRCVWGKYKNDTRYPHLLKRNKNNDPIKFYHFPGPVRSAERTQKWIACHRGDNVLSVPKTAMFAVYILLRTMDQRKKILILYLQSQALKR